MDVHDTPSVSKTSPLQPGMVITVEPGCYIPKSMAKVRPSWPGHGNTVYTVNTIKTVNTVYKKKYSLGCSIPNTWKEFG